MENNKNWILTGRIWFELDGQRILGKGRIELLERIEKSGSIRQAALQMEMSYKQAWDLIKDMNTRFSEPVLISKRGGKGGGNAQITEKGKELIAQFHALKLEFDAFLLQNFGMVKP